MMQDPGLYDPQQDEPSPRLYAAKVVLVELAKILLLVVITIAIVRYFLFRPFDVKGASMEPNFYEQEYLIIDELTYRFNEPARGDVIVLKHKDNNPLAPEDEREYFLKRIIALPGEKIKIQGGKVVIYNAKNPSGTVIDERAYLADFVYTTGELIRTLGPDEYFVLGDNRHVSLDSRSIGPIKRKDIVGRVWLRGWPIDKFGRLQKPTYNF